jgi:hypothetical protein
MSELKDAALSYAAARGWKVFPVYGVRDDGSCTCGDPHDGTRRLDERTIGKHPILPSGFKGASSNPALIAAWWDKWPDANIGNASGEVSGFDVLDIDTKKDPVSGHDGGHSLGTLVAEHGPLNLATLMQETGSGGAQYFMAHAAGVSNRNGVRHAIDVRGDGGYVILPPSRHRSGRRYRWVNEAPIAPWTPWLLDVVTRKKEAAQRPKHTAVPASEASPEMHERRRSYFAKTMDAQLEKVRTAKSGAQFPEKNRNDRLFEAACAAGNMSHWQIETDEDIAAQLLDAALACGLDEGDADRQIWNGIAKGKESPLELEPTWDPPSPTKPKTGGDDGDDSGDDEKEHPLMMLERLLSDDNHRADLCQRAGTLAMDERTRDILIDGSPFGGDTEITDLRLNIIRKTGKSITDDNIAKVLAAVAARNTVSPVKNYLERCRRSWDREERIKNLQAEILNIDTVKLKPLYDEVLRKWFISAVARALNPGCKVDTTLILVGRQGAKKSTFFSVLGGDWFTDSDFDISDKDAKLIIGRNWIVEWSELEAMARARSNNTVKAFLSSRTDTFRVPYGRAPITQPRSCVIVGSTNDESFLSDATGNRRYWTIEVGGTLDIDLLMEWRDQLWGEAVEAYHNKETWWFDDETALNEEREKHFDEDAWDSPIRKFVAGKPEVTTFAVLTEGLHIATSTITKAHQMRVANCLKRQGWTKGKKNGQALWTYTGTPADTSEKVSSEVSSEVIMAKLLPFQKS